MKKTLWFDMDGTIANFYGVENWLQFLQNSDVTPYEIAKPLISMQNLIDVLQLAKGNDWEIGIISWTSKTGTREFNKATKKAKTEWLKKYGLYSLLDEIHVVKYGTNKNSVCKKYCDYGILLDDEQQNLDKWNIGDCIKANNNLIENLFKAINKA